MKRLIAGLMLASLLFAGTSQVAAQNKPMRYDSYAQGAVSYSLNSGGSYYGQLFNSGSASSWSLGFGSSQSTSGTSILSWNSAGHILMNGIAAPTVSAGCGTSPSAVSGSDNAGDVTLGVANSAITTCTITFAAAYSSIPHCFVNNRTSQGVRPVAQATASTLVIVGSFSSNLIGNTSDVIDYFCVGN